MFQIEQIFFTFFVANMTHDWRLLLFFLFFLFFARSLFLCQALLLLQLLCLLFFRLEQLKPVKTPDIIDVCISVISYTTYLFYDRGTEESQVFVRHAAKYGPCNWERHKCREKEAKAFVLHGRLNNASYLFVSFASKGVGSSFWAVQLTKLKWPLFAFAPWCLRMAALPT